MKAQKVLASCFEGFMYSARFLMDSIVGHLKPDPQISHEQFKVSCQGSIADTFVYLYIDSGYIWGGSRGVPIFNLHDTTVVYPCHSGVWKRVVPSSLLLIISMTNTEMRHYYMCVYSITFTRMCIASCLSYCVDWPSIHDDLGNIFLMITPTNFATRERSFSRSPCRTFINLPPPPTPTHTHTLQIVLAA